MIYYFLSLRRHTNVKQKLLKSFKKCLTDITEDDILIRSSKHDRSSQKLRNNFKEI